MQSHPAHSCSNCPGACAVVPGHHKSEYEAGRTALIQQFAARTDISMLLNGRQFVPQRPLTEEDRGSMKDAADTLGLSAIERGNGCCRIGR